MASLVVVCGRDRAPALADVAHRLGVAGLVWVGRRGSGGPDVPRFPTVAAALDAAPGAPGASAVAVLTPYGALADDLALCRRRGVAAVCAGPVPDGPAGAVQQLRGVGRWSCQAALRKLHELARRPGFGQPVYLRRVSGGGTGMLSAWWAVLESLEAATGLLGSPLSRLWIAAARSGWRWHASATAVSQAGATAQLVVTPAPSAGDDAMLLGTGGTITADGSATGAVVTAAHGARLLREPSPWPDADWIRCALAGETALGPPLPEGLAARVLAALRRGARSGRLVRVL